MKIVVLLHAKNAQLLEDYFCRLSEREACDIQKEQGIFTVYVNSDVIEFLEIGNLEQYKGMSVSANIVFYPESESDNVFSLAVLCGFKNINTVIPQLPFLEYDENMFVGTMKEKAKYGCGF